MKAILVWPLCWILYGIGHVASKLAHRWDRAYEEPDEGSLRFRAAFHTYQWAMARSFIIQRWAEDGRYVDSLPWTPADSNKSVER